jgi:hypothetical protein
MSEDKVKKRISVRIDADRWLLIILGLVMIGWPVVV